MAKLWKSELSPWLLNKIHSYLSVVHFSSNPSKYTRYPSYFPVSQQLFICCKSKMLPNSLYVRFWPFMKVLQLLGSCPIQKDSESLSGFKAITSGIYLIVIAAVYIPALGQKLVLFSSSQILRLQLLSQAETLRQKH